MPVHLQNLLIFICFSLNFLISPGYCNSETSNTSDTQTYDVVSSIDDLFEDVTASLDLLPRSSFASDMKVMQTVINLLISSSNFVDIMISPTHSVNDHIMSPTDVTSFISAMSSSNLILPTTSYFEESSIVQDAMSLVSSFVSFDFNPSSTQSFTGSSIDLTTNNPGNFVSVLSSVHMTIAGDTSSFSLFVSSTPSASSLSSERLSTVEVTLISSESLVVMSSLSQVDSSVLTTSFYNSFFLSSFSSRVLLLSSSSASVFSSVIVHSSNIAPSSVGPTPSQVDSSAITASFYNSFFLSPLSSRALLLSSSASVFSSVIVHSSNIAPSSIGPTPSQVDSSVTTTSFYNSFFLSSLSSRVLLLSSSASVFSSVIVHSSSIAPSSVGHTSSLTSSYSMPVSPTVTPVVFVPVVTVRSINATSILVSWSSVPDAIGYIILIRQGNSLVKREANLRITIDAGFTSYIVTDLQPYTSFSIQVASIRPGNVTGDFSESTLISTPEASPSPPVNVTWQDIDDNSVNVSWSSPIYPNGVIIKYIVTITLTGGNATQYNVSATLRSLVIMIDAQDFVITVSVVNSAGTSIPQIAVMIPSETSVVSSVVPSIGGSSPPTDKGGLSGGAVAAIVIICILAVTITVVVVALVLFLAWRKWFAGDGVDETVGEMEYKTGDTRSNDASIDFDESGGSQTQLTAKRWMRANANYSTPSSLLPSIADLVSRYSTAEDVVNKTGDHTQTNGLNAILESTQIEDESSFERPHEASSTVCSPCGEKVLNASNKVSYDPHSFSEREAGMRESEIADGNHPLFEMMENIYLPSAVDFEALKQYHLDSSLIEIKEQIGVGEHCKVMMGVPEMLPFEKNEDVVAVKVLKDDAVKDNLLCTAHILTQFSHHNILNLLAVTASPSMVIVPYLELADLKKYLVRVRRRTRLEYQPCNFTVKDQLNISAQIASGMEYLSSKFYIHRALQSKYILLDEDFNVKISGFQMSLSLGHASNYEDLKKADKLPVKWLSLETLIDGRFTPYTDIWSFGVVLWEIFSYGLTPYRGLQNCDVLQHVSNGERLNKPSDCPQDVYTLMLHCWNERCRDRPSFSELYKHITGITEVTRKTQDDCTFNLNAFDISSVSQSFSTSSNVDTSNQPHLNPVVTINESSPAELEMTEVVLRNHERDDMNRVEFNVDAITEDPSRHSNHSSIPEIVLSTQARPESHQSEVELPHQLTSTEEYTVL